MSESDNEVRRFDAEVDNVAPTPEAVKQWVMDENEYHEKQLRTKLAEVEKERDEANRTVNIVLSSLHWTGDGYEWTGGQYDYRMSPSDALAATQGEFHRLQSANAKLAAECEGLRGAFNSLLSAAIAARQEACNAGMKPTFSGFKVTINSRLMDALDKLFDTALALSAAGGRG